jgi:hypothetical protein
MQEVGTLFQRMSPSDFLELDDRDALHVLCALDLYPTETFSRIDAEDLHRRVEYLCRALRRGEQVHEFTRDPHGVGDTGLDAYGVRELTEKLRALARHALSTSEPVVLALGYSVPGDGLQ